MNISIMIPTKNRTDFILRLLKYYSLSKFSGVLLIGDSSDHKSFEINKSNISKYRKKGLVVSHYLDRTLTADKMVSFLSNNVKTDYSAMVADDDIIITQSISRCIDFLDKNLDYSAIHGKSYLIGVNGGMLNAFGKVTSLINYALPIVESESSIDRIEEYFKTTLNVNMSIIRTKVNTDAFQEVNKLTDYYSSSLFGELIHASVVCSRGKIGEIDETYLIRQFHDEQFYHKIDMTEWFSKSDWCSAYSTLRSVIRNEIVLRNDITNNIDDKISTVLSNWNKFIINSMMRKERLSYAKHKYLPHCFKKFVFLKKIAKYFRFFRSSFYNSKDKIFFIKDASVNLYVAVINKKL